MRTVEHGDVPDPLYEDAAGSCGEGGEELIAREAIAAQSADFDELVILKGACRLALDGGREAGIPEADHGPEAVGKRAQLAALPLRELAERDEGPVRLLHRPILGWNLGGCGDN